MKKNFKTLFALIMVSALAVSSVAAQAQNGRRAEGSEKTEFAQKKGKKNPFRGFKKGYCSDQLVVVGKARRVDGDKITVINADGKEVVVNVSPFTFIGIENEAEKKPAEKAENFEPKKHTLSEIRTGSWVLVSIFKSETKALNACAVFAKVPKTESSEFAK